MPKLTVTAIHSLLSLLLAVVLTSAQYSSAFELELEELGEQGLHIRLIDTGLQVRIDQGTQGERSFLSAEQSVFQSHADGAALSAVISVALPADRRASLHVLHERTGALALPPPVMALDDLSPLSGPRQPGVRLLDAGWLRSQKIQRLALDLAVFGDEWLQLQELEFELRFVPDTRPGATASLAPARRSYQESPAFEALFERQLANPGQAAAWRVDPARRVADGAIRASGGGNPALLDPVFYRIMVREDGIQTVSGLDLQAAGISLAAIQPATLVLWEGGAEVPMLLVDGGDGRFDVDDRLLFVGRKRVGESFPTSFFSPDRAYFLSWGRRTGRRFVDLSATPDPALPDQSVQVASEHFETNRHWNDLESSDQDPFDSDHWFWELFSAVGAPATHSLGLPLQNALGGTAARPDRIRYALRGATSESSAGAEHHALLRVEGTWAGDFTSPGQEEAITPWFSLPPGLLQGLDQATLDVELPLDTGMESELIYLNWVQMEYQQQLSLPAGVQLEIPARERDGDNLLIVDTAGRDVLMLNEDGRRLLGAQQGADGLRLYAEKGGGSLFISDWDDLKRPHRILATTNEHLLDPGQQADLLIIAHRKYLDQLQDLVEFHEASHTVRLLDVESIYCEFSAGMLHSRAIKDFLRHTLLTWQTPAPSYVTLVGKASRANEMELFSEPLYRNEVPTWWTQTYTTGSTPNDEEYCYLVGQDTLFAGGNGSSDFTVIRDRFQDIMLGRISVTTPGQLASFLEKHREYREAEFAGPWMETQVLASDNAGDSENDVFEIGNQVVAQYIVPDAFPVNQIHVRTDSPYQGGALDFIDLFNEGCTILNYNGHGSRNVLSSSSLFRSTDIRFLNNRGKYPIGFAWSCLVGHFDDIDTSSVSELLLRKDGAGCIAFYGASGKATIRVDNPLMTHYFRNQYAEGEYTFGQIVQLTENSMRAMADSEQILRMYNLLGDPALLPAFPRGRLEQEQSHVLAAGGETIAVTLNSDPPGASGDLTIRYLPDRFHPANFQGNLQRQWTQGWTDGQEVQVTLPATGDAHVGMLQFGINTNDGRSVGSLPVFVNTPYAGYGSHAPAYPTAGLPFRIDFESLLEPDSVVIETNLRLSRLHSMMPLGEGRFTFGMDELPANYTVTESGLSIPNYSNLTESMLEDWGLRVEDWPIFTLYGLIYRYLIFDREDFSDANGNGRWDSGEAYVDANGNGQFDPYGEPFEDLDGDGVWDPFDTFIDANNNCQFDPGESLLIDYNGNGEWDDGEPYTDLNGNCTRDGWVSMPGAFVSFHEEESVQQLDSTLVLSGSADPLQVQQRWLLSAAGEVDRVGYELQRLDDAAWMTLWSGEQAVAAGPQLYSADVALAAGPQVLRSRIGPVWAGDVQLPGFDTLIVEDAFWLLHPEQGGGSRSLDAAGHWALSLEGGTLDRPVQLDPESWPGGIPALRESSQGQPGLGFLIPEAADSMLAALDLGPRDEASLAALVLPPGANIQCSIRAGAEFAFAAGRAGDSLRTGLARWVPERGLWVLQPGTSSVEGPNRLLQADLHLATGWLAPVAMDDDQAPELALQVSGQWFAEGDVVVREPVFQFQLNDVNGIDLGEGLGGPRMWLDGEETDPELIQIGEGTTGVLIQWSPGLLDAGSQHEFRLVVNDALGNTAELSSSFRVATRMGLEFFANHPNPFAGQTTFAWSLSNLPGDLRFEVFTPSGRRIRTMHVNTPRIGYDELTWDGRDDKGRQVANGVYFLRVIAGGSNGSVEEVFKLARLQ